MNLILIEPAERKGKCKTELKIEKKELERIAYQNKDASE
jgi:hypothetical protein